MSPLLAGRYRDHPCRNNRVRLSQGQSSSRRSMHVAAIWRVDSSIGCRISGPADEHHGPLHSRELEAIMVKVDIHCRLCKNVNNVINILNR